MPERDQDTPWRRRCRRSSPSAPACTCAWCSRPCTGPRGTLRHAKRQRQGIIQQQQRFDDKDGGVRTKRSRNSARGACHATGNRHKTDPPITPQPRKIDHEGKPSGGRRNSRWHCVASLASAYDPAGHTVGLEAPGSGTAVPATDRTSISQSTVQFASCLKPAQAPFTALKRSSNGSTEHTQRIHTATNRGQTIESRTAGRRLNPNSTPGSYNREN